MRTKNPSLVTKSNVQQQVVSLKDLLRRRRSSLKEFVTASGITTYELIVDRCSRMGCSPPSREEFESLVPSRGEISSPTEGVVVLPPPPVIKESTGEELQIEEFPAPSLASETPEDNVIPVMDFRKKKNRNRGS